MKDTKSFREKHFRGSKIEDAIQFIDKLNQQHQSLLHEYQLRSAVGDESVKQLVEYQKGMATMSMTIKTHLECLFNYQTEEDDKKGA